MTEQKAFQIGIAIIATFTIATPALAALAIPSGMDDMGTLFFWITFGIVGACAGVLIAKIPKKYIRN